jgi:hypothetical protein
LRRFEQFPQLVAARDEQVEEPGLIHLMITLDNWQWILVRQAEQMASGQDQDNLEYAKFLIQTQFGKRLIVLDGLNAYEVIPPKTGDEPCHVTNKTQETTPTQCRYKKAVEGSHQK